MRHIGDVLEQDHCATESITVSTRERLYAGLLAGQVAACLHVTNKG